ncbi:MAG TPA: hypothetical protein VML55_20800 [Planctomycetaceae bacterium]|nr:hypothetical protein [Planctomycetaceae bacterium]
MIRHVTRSLARCCRGIAAAGIVACGAAVIGPEARAADWMFRQSYYSHQLPPEVAAHYPRPQSRSAYRPAITGTTPGLSLRGGYRFSRIFLGSGGATDTTIYREDWYEFAP